MSIARHEIPILEFDTDAGAVIMPDHENLGISLPERAVFAFLGDYIDRYAEEHGGRVVSWFLSATKRYPIYVIEYQGEELCLCQAPVGAAPAAQILDWLISYGVKKIISGGSCGALEQFDEGAILVPRRALRDEGTSYHYAPPSRYMDVNPAALRAIEETVLDRGMKYREVMTWSTDGFFRETKEKVAYRREEGCSVVEMECAALAACAQMRGAVWGEILYTADSLADAEKYDMRNWGGNAFEYALELCLEAARRL